MTAWRDVEAAEPEFAQRVRALFDAHRHKTIATLRADGAWPGEAKISGRAIASGPIADEAQGDRFQADIDDVVHTHLNPKATLLVIEWWTPAHGLRSIERE
jgi:hypothetical protein